MSQVTIKLKNKFLSQYGVEPSILVRVPCSIVLFGDYFGYFPGPVLSTIIPSSLYILAYPIEEKFIQLYSLNSNELHTINLDSQLNQEVIDQSNLPSWVGDVAHTARNIKNSGLTISGFKAVLSTQTPLSETFPSSSALEVGFTLLWQKIDGWEIDCASIPKLLKTADDGNVAKASKEIDRLTSACCETGKVLYIDTAKNVAEGVTFPEGFSLVLACNEFTNFKEEKVIENLINDFKEALEILQQYNPKLKSLYEVSTIEFAAYSGYLEPEICRRAEHIVKERARVKSALGAFKRNDIQSLGALMYSSHASIRDLLGVSSQAANILIELSREIPGAYGAKIVNPIRCGNTVHLVDSGEVNEYIVSLKDKFLEKTGKDLQTSVSKPTYSAEVINYT